MDVLVRLLQLLMLLLTLPLHLMALLGFWQPLCKSYFPYLMAVLAAKTNRMMENKKRELFSEIKKLMGTSGKVALLELGCGTGANFQFYPAGCRITCLDPNPHFEKFLKKSMAENRHLQYERFVVAPGEDMKQVADGSMDVVVCTLVLCSVQSPKRVLQEVHRVLRPVTFFPAFTATLIKPDHTSPAPCLCLPGAFWKAQAPPTPSPHIQILSTHLPLRPSSAALCS
uniref:Thiol methyltransferase 1B n=1 Tax=Urocitellus parryii TaxID=9999 RepID=A0A8D2HZS0_UROPR